MVYQEFEFDLLPPHLRNPYLIPGIHYQDMFKILYSKIWNSGFLDSISRNQRIRVLNYVEYVAMREQRMCYTCEGKWNEDHECENSCFVFFNPFDREDTSVEEQEEKVEENIEQDLFCHIGEEEESEEKEVSDFTKDGYFVDQKAEVNSGKVLVEVSMVEGFKVCDDRDEEFEEVENQDFEEQEEKVEEESVDRVVEMKLEKIVEERVSTFGGYKVCDDKSHREPEEESVSLGKFLETDSIWQFRKMKEKLHAFISLFDIVKNADRVRDCHDDLVGSLGAGHEFVDNLFAFLNWNKRKLISVRVYVNERHWKYKSKLSRVFQNNTKCCIVKKGPREMPRLQFDPGKDPTVENSSINFLTSLSSYGKVEAKIHPDAIVKSDVDVLEQELNEKITPYSFVKFDIEEQETGIAGFTDYLYHFATGLNKVLSGMNMLNMKFFRSNMGEKDLSRNLTVYNDDGGVKIRTPVCMRSHWGVISEKEVKGGLTFNCYSFFDTLLGKNWEVDYDGDEALADENIAAMVLINPGNPCGNVLTYEHLKKIVEMAKELGILVIFDLVTKSLKGDILVVPTTGLGPWKSLMSLFLGFFFNFGMKTRTDKVEQSIPFRFCFDPGGPNFVMRAERRRM